MGRGNIATHYECEGLYYLDRDFLDCFDGELFDYDQSCENWADMISYVKDGFTRRFKSFVAVDIWRGDRHIVLRNEFFEIAVVDGEWCAAWCLLERRDMDDTGRNRTLMRRHCQTYLEAIKRILIKGWGEAVGYGGPWVSGKRYRAEDVA